MSLANRSISLLNIFNSSGYPRADCCFGLDALASHIENGIISVRLIHMGDDPVLELLLQLAADHDRGSLLMSLQRIPDAWRYYASAGGSPAHQFLVCCAAMWLVGRGYYAEIETWRTGKRVDVVADKEWIVECGDTSPEPVFDHLHQNCRQFAVLPFQKLSKDCPLEMCVFSPGPNWTDETIKRITESRLIAQSEAQKAVAALLFGDADNTEKHG